jgi:translation initiation factor 6
MRLELGTVRESPFVGIFSIATEKVLFLPKTVSRKEEKRMTGLFGAEVVKASIANSNLLGVLAAANSRGLLVGRIIEDGEKKELEEAGIRVKKLSEATAVGNLLAVNDSKGVCSGLFSENQVKEIEGFFGVDLMKTSIAGSDVVGASIVATNKGFVLNKNASSQEAEAIESHFGLEGAKGTANAGDLFLGNSVVANSKAGLAGIFTTGFEMARIDEGLRG